VVNSSANNGTNNPTTGTNNDNEQTSNLTDNSVIVDVDNVVYDVGDVNEGIVSNEQVTNNTDPVAGELCESRKALADAQLRDPDIGPILSSLLCGPEAPILLHLQVNQTMSNDCMPSGII